MAAGALGVEMTVMVNASLIFVLSYHKKDQNPTQIYRRGGALTRPPKILDFRMFRRNITDLCLRKMAYVK